MLRSMTSLTLRGPVLEKAESGGIDEDVGSGGIDDGGKGGGGHASGNTSGLPKSRGADVDEASTDKDPGSAFLSAASPGFGTESDLGTSSRGIGHISKPPPVQKASWRIPGRPSPGKFTPGAPVELPIELHGTLEPAPSLATAEAPWMFEYISAIN
mmetsp:Transcript_149886/g.417619  ORF Transcript_149886/g.417619 Transcript_149886/m.417619 type:complete len:156 (+) Transcript_149886:508-975(+)